MTEVLTTDAEVTSGAAVVAEPPGRRRDRFRY
jgi:hypothetical protein